jgi:hypothetical protein
VNAAADGVRAGSLLLPVIEGARARTAGAWENRTVEVADASAAGAFGRLTLSGKIVLREPAESTALNLRLRVSPASPMPADVALLLGMILPQGATTREGTYRIGGTAGRPTIGFDTQGG